MSVTNNLESSVNRAPMSTVDRVWYGIVRSIRNIQAQEYVQRSAQREANGEAAILPTPEQLELMLNGQDANTRRWVRNSLESFESYRASMNDLRAMGEPRTEFPGTSGIQFSPSQVEDFLQTMTRVGIRALGTDDVKCSICMQEYGTARGEQTTNRTTDQLLLDGFGVRTLAGGEAPEYPVKLSCGHVYGEWCIKRWLLARPASCPTCRFPFRPVV